VPEPTANAGAPATGQDAPAASSTANQTKAAPVGPPSRAALQAMLDGNTGKPSAAKTAPTGETQPAAEPRGADAEKKDEGKTADVQAGDDATKAPKDEKEPNNLPPWAAKRIAKERDKRAKVESELSNTQLELKKAQELFQAAVAENERLAEALEKGASFDPKDEALRAAELEKQTAARLAKLKQEHEAALQKQRREVRVQALADALDAQVKEAVADFPLVSRADVKDGLRANPKATPRQIAEALHQQREALALKRGEKAPTKTDAPETVGKPAGRSGFQYPIGKAGLDAYLKAHAAKQQ